MTEQAAKIGDRSWVSVGLLVILLGVTAYWSSKISVLETTATNSNATLIDIKVAVEKLADKQDGDIHRFAELDSRIRILEVGLAELKTQLSEIRSTTAALVASKQQPTEGGK